VATRFALNPLSKSWCEVSTQVTCSQRVAMLLLNTAFNIESYWCESAVVLRTAKYTPNFCSFKAAAQAVLGVHDGKHHVGHSASGRGEDHSGVAQPAAPQRHEVPWLCSSRGVSPLQVTFYVAPTRVHECFLLLGEIRQ
jgi:hypothetical protein